MSLPEIRNCRMTSSAVRRLHQIQRMLDGVRCDSVAMVPRPDHEAIHQIYEAEAALMRAARLLDPGTHEAYLRLGGRV